MWQVYLFLATERQLNERREADRHRMPAVIAHPPLEGCAPQRRTAHRHEAELASFGRSLV